MRALISVSDKTGIVSFSRKLYEMGFEIISTGGTFKVLKENKIPVIPMDEVTEFPEMLDGRVKTLHPKIHGGLLALRDNENHMKTCQEQKISLIDLVVVNLYPFEKTIQNESITIEEAIEQIDIGGPSMLRSAAKNYRSVGVVVHPHHYDLVISELENNNKQLKNSTRAKLAYEVFDHVSHYDTIIAGFLKKKILNDVSETQFPEYLNLKLRKKQPLRYGENPQQKAAFYCIENSDNYGITELEKLHGKELSYNNIVDIESAACIVKELELPGAVIIKHTNPCGAAVGKTVLDAYKKAYEADPVSAFGSIVGINREVDEDTAQLLSKTFVEAIVATGFTKNAFDLLSKKQSIRLVSLNNMNHLEKGIMYKYVEGGFLIQEKDVKKISEVDLDVMTLKSPTQKQLNDLLFAFKMVKYVKSNAIVIAKNGQLVGVGAGQMSRVEAVEIAIKKAGNQVEGAVMASDAFFPFKDSVELAKDAGIVSIIQPGGSKRDIESIQAADMHGLSMVFTGVRHFKH